MRNKLFERLLIISALVFTLSASVLADGSGKKIEQRVDGVKATLILSEDKAKTGENELTVKLYDDKDNPITNAKVKVTAEMDSKNMDDMKMDESKQKSVDFKDGHEEGEYVGSVQFSDKGLWKVRTTFIDNNKERMAEFSVDVVNSGPNWYVIGGFLLVSTLVITTAGISKKKTKKLQYHRK